MLKINEIFYSIQGESSYAGLPCVFVRLAGCNLRCKYCDTTYAYSDGYSATVEQIVKKVLEFRCNLIEITGGEPLLQSDTVELTNQLIANKLKVLVETNGTQNIDILPSSAIRIMDIKCPGSNESAQMDWQNLYRLKQLDEVKFVISHRDDFEWAISIVKKYDLLSKVTLLFSPANSILEPTHLANWILESQLPVRLHLQQHKFISIK